MSATVTFVGFKSQINYIMDIEPKIISINIDNLPEDIVSCNGCSYHGVVTDVPKDTFLPFAEILEKQMNVDEEFKDYVTIPMIVNDTVMFMDLLCNSDDYTAHPLDMIELANMVREKLDKVFPTRKLTYLPQCQEWFKKQEKYHVEHKESMKKIKEQIELFQQLHPH